MNNTKKELLAKIDIVDFISEYVDLKKKGANYVGFSPFKEEKTPSFVVSPSKNIFKDFSTNVGGNVIKFYMLIKDISYNKAVIELAKKFDVKVANTKLNTNNKYYNIMLEARNYYHQNLLNNSIAMNYLKNRGYELEDVKKFKLGFASDKWDLLLNHFKDMKNVSVDDLVELGLISKSNDNYYDTFRNRIMFSILNKNQDIVGFGGRNITSSKTEAKYINSKESAIYKKSNELFGIFDGGQKIKDYKSCILVEGFFDVLSLKKYNIDNVVASLGTSLTNEQAKYIKTLTDNIVISYDDDTAGMNAKIRAIMILNRYGFNIKIMSLKGLAKDPDELLLKYGKEKYVELFNQSQDAFDYLFDYYKKDKDIDKIASKLEIIKNLKEYFNSIQNKIIYNEYKKKLSEKLNITLEALSENIGKQKIQKIAGDENNKQTNKISINKFNSREYLELKTISLILEDSSCYNLFKNFNFINLNIWDLYENMGKKDFDTINCSEEEREILLNAKLIPIKDIETETFEAYKMWIDIYFKESKEIINELTDKYKNMSIEEYTKLNEFIKKFTDNSIKEINKLEDIFNSYLEYEKGKFNVR